MKKWFPFDYWLLLPAVFLTIFGIILLATLANEKYLAIYQGIFLILGLILFYLFARLHYQTLIPIWFYLYVSGIAFLVLVLILGETRFGSSRWINLGFFNFQPSELFKIILTISLIGFLQSKNKFKIMDYFIFLALIIFPVFLIAKEPDLGTALVCLSLGFIIYFVVGKERKYFYVTLLIILLILPLLYQFALKPYQKQRLLTFIDPKKDILGSGYNVWQSIIAVGSGGLQGKGLGRGSQSQLQFLPIRYADFIYATAAEATGFWGSMVIFGLYFALLARIFWTGFSSEEEIGYFLSIAFGSIFLAQIVINIGMNLGVMPISGLPLVFLSYGGSSLLSSYIILGILSNVQRRSKKIIFETV